MAHNDFTMSVFSFFVHGCVCEGGETQFVIARTVVCSVASARRSLTYLRLLCLAYISPLTTYVPIEMDKQQLHSMET